MKVTIYITESSASYQVHSPRSATEANGLNGRFRTDDGAAGDVNVPYKIAAVVKDDVPANHAVRSEDRTVSDHCAEFDLSRRVNSRARGCADARTAHDISTKEVQPDTPAL
jgi:hypothetical protein